MKIKYHVLGERMNYIDKKFKELIEELRLFQESEIESHILEKLKMVPLETQNNIDAFLSQFTFWGRLFDQEDNTIKRVSSLLKQKVDHLESFYESLGDYRSKKTLYAIINNWYNYDFKNLSEVIERYFPHYFDIDLIPYVQDGVFVDLGAYTGDTIEEFVSVYGPLSYQKIYAYEITDESMKVLKETLVTYPRVVYSQKAVMDKTGYATLAVHDVSSSSNQVFLGDEGTLAMTTLDDDIHEKITHIKLDIEGSELSALKGAKRHLIEDKPVLMISIYHGYEDLLRIWEYLESLKINYHYYLRYYGGNVFPTEIVLYAIYE